MDRQFPLFWLSYYEKSIILVIHTHPSTVASLWVKGSDQDTSVFSMIRVTGSIPQFRNPENFWKGRIACSGPNAVADSHPTG